MCCTFPFCLLDNLTILKLGLCDSSLVYQALSLLICTQETLVVFFPMLEQPHNLVFHSEMGIRDWFDSLAQKLSLYTLPPIHRFERIYWSIHWKDEKYKVLGRQIVYKTLFTSKILWMSCICRIICCYKPRDVHLYMNCTFLAVT